MLTQDGGFSYHIADKTEAEFFHHMEEHNLTKWNADLDVQMQHICETNPFYKEFHKQWGHKPGVNSGNAQLEARIPAKLHRMFLAKDPNYISDDRAWNSFINMFPRLRVMPS